MFSAPQLNDVFEPPAGLPAPGPELLADGLGIGVGAGMPPDVPTPPAPVDNVVND
jgi:hypothetical protein